MDGMFYKAIQRENAFQSHVQVEITREQLIAFTHPHYLFHDRKVEENTV